MQYYQGVATVVMKNCEPFLEKVTLYLHTKIVRVWAGISHADGESSVVT